MKLRILLLAHISLLLLSNVYSQTDYEIIIENIQNDVWNSVDNISTLDATVTANINSIQSNGSWNDINYYSTAETGWSPINHLERIERFAKAYTLISSSYYQNPNLHSKIVNALNYWDSQDPQSTNWWWNKIQSPKKIGIILITLRAGSNQISPTLENNLIFQMNRGNPEYYLAANKLDIATGDPI